MSVCLVSYIYLSVYEIYKVVFLLIERDRRRGIGSFVEADLIALELWSMKLNRMELLLIMETLDGEPILIAAEMKWELGYWH